MGESLPPSWLSGREAGVRPGGFSGHRVPVLQAVAEEGPGACGALRRPASLFLLCVVGTGREPGAQAL